MKRRDLVIAALIVGGLVLASAVAVARLAGDPVGLLTRDAAASAGLPPYTGVISTFTVMVWFAAGTLSAFIAWTDGKHRRRLAPFAYLLLALAADDALLLHESVGPRLGIHELLIYAVYGLGALRIAYLMLGEERIVALAFWTGAALLAISVLVDVAFLGAYLLEDGAKLLGVLVWSTVPLLAHSAPRAAVPVLGLDRALEHRSQPG
ncbi:hypothetical protein [Blastococcus goldschmidtiae]|uniref:DUF4386 family protein n=1 Tax=Blastococcus goldschmidtiae TaxID=3075546 RepID=A0ABU2K6A1_9ACTN|nr:hypothetical protein [Blastococcus sp. DSM 46792]MDT0275705.1 hypothetical protein [Blastococcus sp. DSM 46792]